MSARRFRKLPVEVDAMLFDGEIETAIAIIDWALASGATARFHDAGPELPSLRQIAIDTLEGAMRANAGDWVIRGVKGEFYPCKPDIFDETYEAVLA